MRYLHTMLRVTDLDASLRFYCDYLGLQEIRRNDYPQGKFTGFSGNPRGYPDLWRQRVPHAGTNA